MYMLLLYYIARQAARAAYRAYTILELISSESTDHRGGYLSPKKRPPTKTYN